MRDLAFYRSMWGPLGFDGDITNLPAICEETMRRGYVGIETNPLLLRDNLEQARGIIEDHGLSLLSRAHTVGRGVEDHLGWGEALRGGVGVLRHAARDRAVRRRLVHRRRDR